MCAPPEDEIVTPLGSFVVSCVDREVVEPVSSAASGACSTGEPDADSSTASVEASVSAVVSLMLAGVGRVR